MPVFFQSHFRLTFALQASKIRAKSDPDSRNGKARCLYPYRYNHPVRVADFQFHLPPELIAQHPPNVRGSSRMLLVDRHSGAVADDQFLSLPNCLAPGDLLILNDTRVLPARLFATRARGLHTQGNSPTPTGRIEVLLTEDLAHPADPHPTWRALVRPARKVLPGETLLFPHPDHPANPLLTAEVLATGDRGERTLRFTLPPTNPRTFLETIERIGHMPLPPYIHRDQAHTPDTPEDRDRYQTVYAQTPESQPPGSSAQRSAAAPTAGLHFTPEMLAELRTRGVDVHYVTLHVGLGTFQPVRVDQLADIRLHAEPYTLPASTAEALNRARRPAPGQAPRRIIAVGTTTTRTLEHIALQTEQAGTPDLLPHSGSTALFLAPGHRFRLVSGLLTNFHLPESTLLMLVSAFLAAPDSPDQGRKLALRAYAHAVHQRYRFFSYGDCMLML